MAGHSKRHNIKHRKAAQDAKKSKILAQASKQIQLSARQGDDPSLNPELATALAKAKQVGLNKDAIQKAIDKGAGNIAGEQLEEIYYEGYGSGGIALYIKCITGNTKRSGANVRAILTRYGGSMGAPGSVAWQFQQKGELYVDGFIKKEYSKGKEVEEVLPLDKEMFELDLLETAAEDYDIEEGVARVVTARDDLVSVVHILEEKKWHIDESGLIFVADTTITLDAQAEEKLYNLIEALEEDEDVDTIWHNAG